MLDYSRPFIDPTDSNAQALLSTLLGQEFAPNPLDLANTPAKMHMGLYDRLSGYLQPDQTEVPPSLPFLSYTENYVKTVNVVLNVSQNKQGLHLGLQRLKDVPNDTLYVGHHHLQNLGRGYLKENDWT